MAAKRRELPADDIVRAYQEGTSAKNLSETHECSQGAVLRVLREAGVAIRPRGGKKRVALPLDTIKQEYAEGLSTTALADRHGCSASTISRTLVSAGVQLRPKTGMKERKKVIRRKRKTVEAVAA